MNQQYNQPEKEYRFDPELLEQGLKCDLDQLEMLKRCSDKKDITEWNNWKKEHSDEDIFLEGVNLSLRFLANLNLISLKSVDSISLKETDFIDTDLRESNLIECNLEGADFEDASLQGAILSGSNLKGANFTLASVDSNTVIWRPKVNSYSSKRKYTDFTGVALDIIRIDPATKQLLEYNIRVKNWEEWYQDENEPIRHGIFIFKNKKIRLKTNQVLRKLVHNFWWISNYGISTKQIIKVFFMLAIIFAGFYLGWGLFDYYILDIHDNPGIVSNLFIIEIEGTQETVSSFLVPFRAIYFSIVTMTTLGFGDMYASANGLLRGFFGHLLLAFQVILGYVLLGALVTRFAVLFTAGGPAGTFADKEESQKDKIKSKKEE